MQTLAMLWIVLAAPIAVFGFGQTAGRSNSMRTQTHAYVETVSGELDGGTGGVSVDRKGNVLVADFGAILEDAASMGRKIFRLSKTGRVDVFASGFEGASGNEFDSNGFLFQSNIRGNSVSRIAPDGTHVVFAREGIDAPVGITIDRDDVIFVANCGNGTIQRVTPDGDSRRFVSSDLLKCPNGITLDDDGNLYVANFDNGDVLKITPTREVSRLATIPGNNNGHLTFHDGSLYVVARSDHRIYRVSLSGAVNVLAGSGVRGRQDGPLESARFSLPNDIALDLEGTSLYVNEVASATGDSKRLAPMVLRRIWLDR